MKRNGYVRDWKKVCIAGLMIAGGAVLRADENDQTWLTGTVKWKATEHVSFKLGEQFRYRDENRYWRRTDLGIGYAFNKTWSIGATYRYVEKQNKSGDWQECDGYLLDINHTAKGFGAKLKSRMRVCYFDPKEDNLYRNRNSGLAATLTF